VQDAVEAKTMGMVTPKGFVWPIAYRCLNGLARSDGGQRDHHAAGLLGRYRPTHDDNKQSAWKASCNVGLFSREQWVRRWPRAPHRVGTAGER